MVLPPSMERIGSDGSTSPGASLLSRPKPRDAVAVLTAYVGLVLFIPSPLILGPLGASGTPANLFGIGLLVWWALAKIGTNTGVARGRQPVRVALLLVTMAMMASCVGLLLRPSLGAELTGAARGLLAFAALFGVALFAADGISSLERLHVLVRRLVLGVSLVASLGIVEFVAGFNPAQQLSIPALVRNLDLPDQGRSSFLRVQSTALHPIELGSLLGIMLPIAVHLALHARTSRQRIAAWIQVGAIAAVLPLAISRTGLVAAVLGLVTLALSWTWAGRAVALAVVAVFVALMRVAVPGLVGTLGALFTNLFQDTSTTDRTGRYEIAGHHLLQSPWFGRGLNTLYPATQQIFDNAYLYLATETGLVGVGSIVLLLLIMVCTARGARRRAPNRSTAGLGQALTGTFVAMLVVFATADMLSFSLEMGVLFLLVGITGALWRLTGGPGASEAPAAHPTGRIAVVTETRRRAGGAQVHWPDRRKEVVQLKSHCSLGTSEVAGR